MSMFITEAGHLPERAEGERRQAIGAKPNAPAPNPEHVRIALNQNGFEPALQEMPGPVMPAVETLRIDTV